MSFANIHAPLAQDHSLVIKQEEVKVNLLPSKISTTLKKLNTLAYAFLLPLNLTFDSPQATLSIFKKVDRNILPLVKSLKDLPLKRFLNSSLSIMNTMQLTAHLDYWASKKYIKDSMQAIAGHVALFISQASESFVWMLKIAGNTRMLSKISTLGNCLIHGSLAISHFLFSTNILCHLKKTSQESQKKISSIELIKNAAECALALTMVGSSISTPPIAALASLCISLELTHLIYKHQYVDN